MKLEAMLLAHTLYSGAGTVGSVLAFKATDMGMILLPLSVFAFMLFIDFRHIYKDLFNVKRK